MGNPIEWKSGRGKLGVFTPLLGRWKAEADSQMGPHVCYRTFEYILDRAYIQLTADWSYGEEKKRYSERAIIGVNADGEIGFWSFTSDKRSSEGTWADVTDIAPEAIGFEAMMPAGLARMAYWPHEEEGFLWAAEAHNKNGWKRFIEHHYLPVG